MLEAEIDQCRAALSAGEYLGAYELARTAIDVQEEAESPPLTELKYLAVLALARMGATAQARQSYQRYHLHQIEDVDIAALDARIEKDFAINSPGDEQQAHYLAAARRYEEVFARHDRRDYYPAINAASMYALGGEAKLAAELATSVLQLLEGETPNYWSQASAAEAHLVLGNEQACIEVLQAAASSAGGFADIASTRRQFRLLTQNTQVLDALPLPTVIHYAGHIISAKSDRFPASAEPDVATRIRQKLVELDARIAYGSLAAGADILFAEAILERGGELHVVLPFDEQDFIEVSVAPSGAQWVDRFRACLAQASTCTFSSQGGFDGNNALFNHCTVYAMGRACLRRQHLDSPLAQVVVWNGAATDQPAGTFRDRALWVSLGYDSFVIPVFEASSSDTDPHTADSAQAAVPAKSTVIGDGAVEFDSNMKAVVFGDVAGFSKLSDSQIPVFVREVLGKLALSLEQTLATLNAENLLSVNTWGDGLFIVFKDVLSAAKCAHAMQQTMTELDLEAFGIEQQPQLRLGAHFGPVFEFEDPITKRLNYFGHHVNTAARIEPIAPQGEVYVTEAFAAQLALDPHQQYRADYVGVMELAKEFGEARMYLLQNPAL